MSDAETATETSVPEWFETELVTRGTEIDFTATVGMPVVLRYFELLRWGAMVEPAFGLRTLIDAGHFFVVRSQTIELRERIGQRIPLRMRTRIQSAGRSTATVLHEALMADGTLVARARVLGVWLGPDRRIARLPDHFRALAPARAAPSDASSLPARHASLLADVDAGPARVASIRGGIATSFIDPPRVSFTPLSLAVDAPAEVVMPVFEHRLRVPPRDLDVFSHLNAATWLAYADDAREHAAAAAERDPELARQIDPEIARGYVPRVAIFYGREAALHDELRIALAPLGPLTESHALGVWFFRDADLLCTMRLDLAPGLRPVTVPGM